MEENKDYQNLVARHIEKDKLLSSTNPKYHPQILKLLKKKELIKNKNGFWAEKQINSINKKLSKIQNKK